MLQAFFRPKTDTGPDITDNRSADDHLFLEKSRIHLEALEIVRQEKFKSYQARKKIAVPVVTILTPIIGYIDYWLLLLQSSSDDKGAGLTVAFLGAVYWWVTDPKRQYAKAYKQKMLPEIARLFGNFQYQLNGQIPVSTMQASGILPRHDVYKAEDYFSGTYQGVAIQFCEMEFKQRRKSGKNTTYVTVFKGLGIMLDLKTKRFYGHTILDRDKGKIASWFKEKSSKLKTANLVDPEFEKLFDVYTSDQVEARYLIDPVMIERIKGLQAEYEGESLVAAFYESRMLILIQSKHNHFEPADLQIPATDPRSVLNMKREIGEILSVIDRLSLYDPAKVHAQAA